MASGHYLGIVGLALSLMLASSCVAKHVVRPDTIPPYPEKPADLKELTLYLRQLNIAGKASSDTEEDVTALRAGFCDYAARLGRFRGVIDLKATPNAPILPGVYVDVDLMVEHSSSRTYVLDALFFYPFVGYWPVTPQWGTASVKARVYAFDDKNNELWRTEQTGESAYWVVFYSWYRNSAIEHAYSEAYAQSFEAALKKLTEAKIYIPGSTTKLESSQDSNEF